MSDSILDNNHIKSKLGVLFSDGMTLVPIKISSDNGGAKMNLTDSVDAAILALYAAGKPIPRDANGTPAWSAQSNADAAVEYPIFVDADGAILLDF